MKKVILVACALVLVVGSLSMMAVGQDPDQSQSQVQACTAMGYQADICATCAVAGIAHGGQDYGPCFCKFDQALRSQFATMGECVVYVQQTLRPVLEAASQQ